MQRHEAKRSARADGGLEKRIQDIGLKYFDPDMWYHDPTWQENNPQYRDVDSTGFTSTCIPTSLTRVFSLYHPEITSSTEQLQNKFEEIYHAHPRRKSHEERGWTSGETVDYLNTELEEGRLRIPMPEGKGVRFKVREDFSYADLKDTFMNVKDGQGNYIPTIIVIVGANFKEADNPGAHAIVLHKQGDHYDQQGNHYPDFVVYNPYYVIKPASKYALGHILEISHAQTKLEGDKLVYKPGHMGPNLAVVPVVYDVVPDPVVPDSAQGSWASFKRIFSRYTGTALPDAPKRDE